MEAELAGEDHGLLKAGVAEIAGLVFVWLGPEPGPIDDAAAELELALAPQGLERAQVAHQREYEVQANWKLVWENNRECWHCHLGHPQYVKANFDIARETVQTRAVMSARARDHARALGGSAVIDHTSPGLYSFPSYGRWWSANRTALAPGFVTESVDGHPVSRLMGEYAGYDVGTLRIRTVPNFWCHASSDHAVLTWLVPDGPERTRITVQWLVDRDAVEGRDFTLARLLPFWQLTSEQDWSLCERNQRGVSNPAFRPGPYSREREYNVLAFVEWYLERVAERKHSGAQATAKHR
jgi:Rieske 2Fe-2S family protein